MLYHDVKVLYCLGILIKITLSKSAIVIGLDKVRITLYGFIKIRDSGCMFALDGLHNPAIVIGGSIIWIEMYRFV